VVAASVVHQYDFAEPHIPGCTLEEAGETCWDVLFTIVCWDDYGYRWFENAFRGSLHGLPSPLRFLALKDKAAIPVEEIFHEEMLHAWLWDRLLHMYFTFRRLK